MTEDRPKADRLSLERTRLANERTLLAYVRTALALMGGGVAAIELIEIGWAGIAGGVLLGAGVITLFFGIWRYFAVNRALDA